jgi:molybdopterin-guanine dinucleotide biosynthesis protein A
VAGAPDANAARGELTGVVLAGGASSRFGTPKAGAPLNGRPLIQYPLAAMRQAGLPRLVVAKADNEVERFAAGAEVLIEPEHPRHPLRGIVSALQHTSGPVVVCACDMPFVNAGLIQMLAGLPDALAVVQAGGLPQPMLGRYTPAVLDALIEAMTGELPVREALRAAGARLLPTESLSEFGDPELLVRDIDTPEQLAAAEALVAGR